MDDVRHHLGPRDRLDLLCWLTCGSLGAYYLNESWPDTAFYVQAAHKWLARHNRQADWLAVARLSALAREIAARHAGFIDTTWAQDAVEEIIDAEDLNHQTRLALEVLDDCRKELADKRIAD